VLCIRIESQLSTERSTERNT